MVSESRVQHKRSSIRYAIAVASSPLMICVWPFLSNPRATNWTKRTSWGKLQPAVTKSAGLGTPLVDAFVNERPMSVKALVQKGARLECTDSTGVYRSALKSAVRHPIRQR
ncbi:uncharacterized protein BCR38DRAFT_411754 [Pseudomassariella vexata]|uniref:Ankyrin repeat-containing domain protein n=1 Tax=Pseudomassariella vexata TaxID=1141098 RepID=A0A1Y2DPM3_9PEZI|nr:uncharacterized protein BCR38DRAFT_411754 [Pseudomassariella vexata]ORY60615.1 hypothetical protein BCR38DRAFT_411754 [Pseudomassariella vexata]